MSAVDGNIRRVVIGGGVAGVCCAQELARLHPQSRIILICEGSTIVEVTKTASQHAPELTE